MNPFEIPDLLQAKDFKDFGRGGVFNIQFRTSQEMGSKKFDK